MKTLSWDKIQQGDEEAFRQLYEQYADLLYGYGMKIAGDDTLVTEAIQSLFFLKIFKKETIAAPQNKTPSLRKEKLARHLNPYPLTCVFR